MNFSKKKLEKILVTNRGNLRIIVLITILYYLGSTIQKNLGWSLLKGAFDSYSFESYS